MNGLLQIRLLGEITVLRDAEELARFARDAKTSSIGA